MVNTVRHIQSGKLHATDKHSPTKLHIGTPMQVLGLEPLESMSSEDFCGSAGQQHMRVPHVRAAEDLKNYGSDL